MSHQKNESYFRALAEAEAAKDLRRAHAKRVLAYQEDQEWLGPHSLPEPDHAGWDSFVVYAKRNAHSGVRTFFWTATDDDGSPVGFEHGPFQTAREAYNDAA